jgi:hypothetical protein
MDVELLVIPGCPNTAAAVDLMRQALSAIGLSGQSVRTTVVGDDAQARRRNFPGSPTFLINGVDPFAEHLQQPAVACRLYDTPTGRRGTPDPIALRQALQAAADTEPGH